MSDDPKKFSQWLKDNRPSMFEVDRDFLSGFAQAADDSASILKHVGPDEAAKQLTDELAADTIADDERLEHDPPEPAKGSLIGWRVGMETALEGKAR